MRGDRLLQILLLLQTHGKMQTKQLSEQLEVSERTIHRDMEALSSAGIPVIAERGKSGGWSLMDNYRTNLTGMKESEIRSLFISYSTQMLEDLGLADSFNEAQLKLLASVPSGYREQTHEVWNRIHIDTSTWRNRKEVIATFEILKEAIWDERALSIEYQRADGSRTRRIVGPLGLVAKGSRWYLVASGEDGDIRTYRASRIHSAEVSDKTVKRPKDFHLVQYWQSSTQSFIEHLPSFDVVALASPALLPRLTYTDKYIKSVEIEVGTGIDNDNHHTRTDHSLHGGGVEDANKQNYDRWARVKLSFDTEDEAASYLLGYGDQIKVVEPEHLRVRIVNMAERVLAFYRDHSDE